MARKAAFPRCCVIAAAHIAEFGAPFVRKVPQVSYLSLLGGLWVSQSDACYDCGHLDKVVSVCYNWVNKSRIGGSCKMSTNKDYLNFLLDQLSSL